MQSEENNIIAMLTRALNNNMFTSHRLFIGVINPSIVGACIGYMYISTTASSVGWFGAIQVITTTNDINGIYKCILGTWSKL